MAARIPPGGQTAGLDALYLDPDPGWMPKGTQTAAGILAPFAQAATALADQGTTPIRAALNDTSQLEADQNTLAEDTQAHINQAAVDTGDVSPLRDDHLAPQFGPISENVQNSGDHLGVAGTAPNIPPPHDPPDGPWNDPGGGGRHV